MKNQRHRSFPLQPAAIVAVAHLIEVMYHFSDTVRSDRLVAFETVKP